MNTIKNPKFLPIDISRVSPNFKPKFKTLEHYLTKLEMDNMKKEEEDDEEEEENIKKAAQQQIDKKQACQKQYDLEEQQKQQQQEQKQQQQEQQQQQQDKLEDRGCNGAERVVADPESGALADDSDEQFKIEIGGGIILTKKKQTKPKTNTKKRKQTKGRTKKRKSKRRMTKKRSRRKRP